MGVRRWFSVRLALHSPLPHRPAPRLSPGAAPPPPLVPRQTPLCPALRLWARVMLKCEDMMMTSWDQSCSPPPVWSQGSPGGSCDSWGLRGTRETRGDQGTRVQTSSGGDRRADCVPCNKTRWWLSSNPQSSVFSHLELDSGSGSGPVSAEVERRAGGVSGSRAPRDFLQLWRLGEFLRRQPSTSHSHAHIIHSIHGYIHSSRKSFYSF